MLPTSVTPSDSDCTRARDLREELHSVESELFKLTQDGLLDFPPTARVQKIKGSTMHNQCIIHSTINQSTDTHRPYQVSNLVYSVIHLAPLLTLHLDFSTFAVPVVKMAPNWSYHSTNSAFGVKGFTFTSALKTSTSRDFHEGNSIRSQKFEATRPSTSSRGRSVVSFDHNHHKAGWAASLHKFPMPPSTGDD
jgi:hypothetical protein